MSFILHDAEVSKEGLLLHFHPFNYISSQRRKDIESRLEIITCPHKDALIHSFAASVPHFIFLVLKGKVGNLQLLCFIESLRPDKTCVFDEFSLYSLTSVFFFLSLSSSSSSFSIFLFLLPLFLNAGQTLSWRKRSTSPFSKL